MGKYIVNADDISDRNLERAYRAMLSDLRAMQAEAREAALKVRERQDMRSTNFDDSGGAAAFGEDELQRHAQEGARLGHHETILGRINWEAGALGNVLEHRALRSAAV